jgi:hypothetical protein
VLPDDNTIAIALALRFGPGMALLVPKNTTFEMVGALPNGSRGSFIANGCNFGFGRESICSALLCLGDPELEGLDGSEIVLEAELPCIDFNWNAFLPLNFLAAVNMGNLVVK